MNIFKPVLKPDPDQKVFRARTDVIDIKCSNCGKTVYKQDAKQIVFFCSKQCRRELRDGKRIKKGKPAFRIV